MAKDRTVAKGTGAKGTVARHGDPLQGIVGAGGSRVSLDAATRAREVSSPTAADLAAAERTVVLRRAYRSGRTPDRS